MRMLEQQLLIVRHVLQPEPEPAVTATDVS